jgi:formate/nitrite transporter FocA (FNT family)
VERWRCDVEFMKDEDCMKPAINNGKTSRRLVMAAGFAVYLEVVTVTVTSLLTTSMVFTGTVPSYRAVP